MPTNQQYWQERMRREGRCPHCGVKLAPGEKMCEMRREQKRAAAKRAYNRQNKGAA